MSEERSDPKRLTGADEARTPEERWLRRAFSEAAVLTAASARASRRTRRFAHPRWIQLVLAVAVLMLAGATFAAFQRFVRPRLASRTAAVPAPSPRARPRRAIAEAAPVAPPVVPPVTPPEVAPVARPEVVAPAVEEPPHRAPARARQDGPAATLPLRPPRWPLEDARPAPRPAATATAPASSEAEVLARAISHLRAERDARATLDDLADYDRRFPDGLLAQEALRIRTEALLDAGRGGEALTRLDEAGPTALTRPLRLVRGELRARAGRCTEALDDLAPLADDDRTPAVLAERAIYARASCHAQLHHIPAARADLTTYEARFPDGAFRNDAAAFLRATAP